MGNPVGKWQLRGSHGLVTAAVRAAQNNEELVVFGQGANARDYFDANDLAQFIVDLCENTNHQEGTYNIGSGYGLTENEVIALVEETLQRHISVRFQPARPFDLPYSVLDVSKAKRLLAWRPTTPLRETILRIREGLSDPLVLD